jgi:hypothetical protein
LGIGRLGVVLLEAEPQITEGMTEFDFWDIGGYLTRRSLIKTERGDPRGTVSIK